MINRGLLPVLAAALTAAATDDTREGARRTRILAMQVAWLLVPSISPAQLQASTALSLAPPSSPASAPCASAAGAPSDAVEQGGATGGRGARMRGATGEGSVTQARREAHACHAILGQVVRLMASCVRARPGARDTPDDFGRVNSLGGHSIDVDAALAFMASGSEHDELRAAVVRMIAMNSARCMVAKHRRRMYARVLICVEAEAAHRSAMMHDAIEQKRVGCKWLTSGCARVSAGIFAAVCVGRGGGSGCYGASRGSCVPEAGRGHSPTALRGGGRGGAWRVSWATRRCGKGAGVACDDARGSGHFVSARLRKRCAGS